MLIDGKWHDRWTPVDTADEAGRFLRRPSSFRSFVTPDSAPGPTGEGGFAAEAGRYHLYVALICPWASRTLMVRSLKGLDDVISVSVVEPLLTDRGWKFGSFPRADAAGLNGESHLYEVYLAADPCYTGRATVPVLWDKARRTIVNNESADIVKMLNSAFDAIGQSELDLRPEPWRDEIARLNKHLYENLNNGVYQAGFARSQTAYDEAVARVFATLEEMEQRLSDGRFFLMGETLSEPDIRLFVTLVRFDHAYHGVFKCNRKRLVDYPRLLALTRRILAIEGMAETVDIDHIVQGYYSIETLNPLKIVPTGPAWSFLSP